MSERIDRHSATWEAVRAACEREIAEARSALETTGTDIAVTEFHRGRIATARALLAMETPRQASEPSENPY